MLKVWVYLIFSVAFLLHLNTKVKKGHCYQYFLLESQTLLLGRTTWRVPFPLEVLTGPNSIAPSLSGNLYVCSVHMVGGMKEAEGMPRLSPIWHFPKSDWVNLVCSGLAGCYFAVKSVHGEWWNKINSLSGEFLSSCTGNNITFACL